MDGDPTLRRLSSGEKFIAVALVAATLATGGQVVIDQVNRPAEPHYSYRNPATWLATPLSDGLDSLVQWASHPKQ